MKKRISIFVSLLILAVALAFSMRKTSLSKSHQVIKPSEISEAGQPLNDLKKLENESHIENSFEGTLEAKSTEVEFIKGTKTKFLTYNDMIPGPLIEVYEGTEIKIKFKNNLPAQDTTIHWHGLPVPPDQDGNPMNPVKPNTEVTYRFKLPPDSAGTYWYHPHPHEITAEQVYKGLAGIFIIKSKHDIIDAGIRDKVIVISDLRLDTNGQIDKNNENDLMNGREGDITLVNGQLKPRLAVNPGETIRLRFLNATNSRYFKLSIPNAELTLIGTDGGLISRKQSIKELLIAPGERYEVLVKFSVTKNNESDLVSSFYDRGWMGGEPLNQQPLKLMSFLNSNDEPVPNNDVPEILRKIETLVSGPIVRKIVLSEKMDMSGNKMTMAFLINGKAFDMNRIDFTSKAGETETWEIDNQADMDHPFHIHGTQFQVLNKQMNGKLIKADEFQFWKDTINIAKGEKVKILVRQNEKGLRMFHCHILEHEQLGMMGIVKIE